MRDAVAQFFPDAGIIESVLAKGTEAPDAPPEKSRKRASMRRSVSGVSDLVGANNGERPGGFVLVIDGVALGHVRSRFVLGFHIVGD
jgi:phospholipid-translocating ATPase